ncbi:MAG TPA: bifunctional glycosyltransferase family 2/GtrA family protein [Streptosporangiaceae bacterium]|nr:bifunctional glycosyltransferase family 2/GtrA family protein [Streptosporangiaceae bacterium]
MRVLQVDIVVPVRNEEHDLAPSVRRLVGYLREGFPFTARVTIADNGSTDGTWAIAARLARELAEVRAVRMEEPGRGRALRAIWSQSDAEVLAYMDVDLSTDLNALLPLVAPLLSGHSDLAIGTRLARGSRVIRGPKRELISRCYNMLLHACMGVRFSDAQCGFKAIRCEQARALLPLTRDTGWFFDTELLVLAERAGLRIHEIPVDWIDDLDSRVDVVATALADLRGMARLGSGLARGSIQVPSLRGSALARGRSSAELPLQIASFAVVGIISTIAYVLLYLLLRGVMSAQPANVLSLLVTAVANTAANRRLTFGISGRQHAARHQVKGLIAVGIGLALTSGALAVLNHPSRGVEVSVLVAANLVATVIRFVLYRTWVFGKSRPNKSDADKGEPIERDHLRGEAFDPHRPAAHAEPGPAPAARA